MTRYSLLDKEARMTETINNDTALKDPESRAVLAYFKRCQEEGVFYQQPASYSGVREYDSKKYVVLENINGPLAVYLVQPDGSLEDLEDYSQWPGDLGKIPDDVLTAWALTADEAGDDFSSIIISREGANHPEPGIDAFGGDLGPDEWNFNADAADALLSANGYRRTSRWERGMSPVTDRHGLGNGHSCEVEKISEHAS
jgi:hypothetical protein